MFNFRDFPSEERLQQAAQENPNMDITASRAFIRLMHTSSMAFETVNEYMSHFDLSHGRFLIMMLVGKMHPEGLSPSEIAEKLSVTRATVTSLVEKLERDGLVKREHRTDDRRAVTVRVTEAGTAHLKRIFPGHVERVKKVMAPLTVEERAQFVDLLLKVQEGIKSLPPLEETIQEIEEVVSQ